MQKSHKLIANVLIALVLGVFCSVSIGFAAPAPTTGGTTDSGTAVGIPVQVANMMATAKAWISYVAGGLAFIFFILGGINFITANGDPEKIKLAKEQIKWAFIGAIVVALAIALVNIANYIGGSFGGSNTANQP